MNCKICALNLPLDTQKYFKWLIYRYLYWFMAVITLDLSEQQESILRYVIKGRSNEQIGDLLNISEKEVANYRKSLMKHVGVKTNEDLIIWIKGHNILGA